MLRSWSITVRDNPMLYKDITQWLRQKGFGLLFMLLLFLGEAVSILIASLSLEEGSAGPATFMTLSVILVVYGIIVIFMSTTHTMREYKDGTFELYELAGLSLEKMIFGKFVAIASEFLFGFFALAPFLFFSYQLGGVDFTVILTVLGGIGLAVPIAAVSSIAFAFMNRKKGKSVGSVFGRILIGLVIFIAFNYVVVFIVLILGSSSFFSSGGSFVKRLFEFDTDAIFASLAFLYIYILGWTLFFFIGCHRISPKCDTRETAIKFLTFLIACSVVVKSAYDFALSNDKTDLRLGAILLFIMPLVTGLMFVFGRAKPPRMAIKRRDAAKLAFSRWVYFLFESGAKGTQRTLFLYTLAACAFLGVAVIQTPAKSYWETVEVCGIAFMAPYFVAMATSIFLTIGSLRQAQSGAFAASVLIFWVISGAILMIVTGTYTNGYNQFGETYQQILGLLCIVGSPISALSVLSIKDIMTPEVKALVEIILGLWGLWQMNRVIRRYLGKTGFWSISASEREYSASPEASPIETPENAVATPEE
jgi:hypothetical protein